MPGIGSKSEHLPFAHTNSLSTQTSLIAFCHLFVVLPCHFFCASPHRVYIYVNNLCITARFYALVIAVLFIYVVLATGLRLNVVVVVCRTTVVVSV